MPEIMKCDDETTAVIKGGLWLFFISIFLIKHCKQMHTSAQRSDYPSMSDSAWEELQEAQGEPAISMGQYMRYTLFFLVATLTFLLVAACGCHELNDKIEESDTPALNWAKNETTYYLYSCLLGCLAAFLAGAMVNKGWDALSSVLCCPAWGAKLTDRGEQQSLWEGNSAPLSLEDAGPSKEKPKVAPRCNLL